MPIGPFCDSYAVLTQASCPARCIAYSSDGQLVAGCDDGSVSRRRVCFAANSDACLGVAARRSMFRSGRTAKYV